MKVSIITPSFNQARYLETTIRSVLGQRYQDLDYIIIDGGSTDGSIEIIRKYQDHLSWWVSEPDKGQAQAINKGFQKATGDVVGWLNSDDVYAPGAVNSAVKAFLQSPEVGLVYGDAISIDQDGSPFYQQVFDDYSLKELVAFHIICQPAVFFRRESLECAGYLDENYHFLLDHQLWLRIAQFVKIRHIAEIWAFARYHPGAKNITRSAEFSQEAFQILEWMKGEPRLARIIAENEKEVMAMVHRFAGRYYLDGGKSWKALQQYARSVQWSPKIAFEEWQRILFSGLSVLGMGSFSILYYRLRTQKFLRSTSKLSVKNIDRLYAELET